MWNLSHRNRVPHDVQYNVVLLSAIWRLFSSKKCLKLWLLRVPFSARSLLHVYQYRFFFCLPVHHIVTIVVCDAEGSWRNINSTTVLCISHELKSKRVHNSITGRRSRKRNTPVSTTSLFSFLPQPFSISSRFSTVQRWQPPYDSDRTQTVEN